MPAVESSLNAAPTGDMRSSRHWHYNDRHHLLTELYGAVCNCHQCSINTSLYPMIGSCTTSSCHVGSLPRPHVHHSSSTLTDCSTCCVYEYALDTVDSLQSPEIVDCSAMKATSSLSWSTVHSAPAVLGRLSRYRAPYHRSVYNCTNRRVTRPLSDCYHYQTNIPAPCHHTYTTRPSDDDGCHADERYYKLSPSLRVAKPVLADTQYWV